MPQDIDLLSINTIRTLAMDAVQKANSGHPGTPMALAPLAYELWQERLRYDPADPTWPDRDRFVLSCGHASMLLYAVLHLAGVRAFDPDQGVLDEPAVSLDDIRKFRQLDSRCPGHPEYRLTTGVETTTGPLGQGVGNSVGMAIASRWLAAHFNRPGFELFGFRVYAFASDGDLMEGISHEAASIAGHLNLSNLCWVYDNNRITIEGSTELALGDDPQERFRAYGWHTVHVTDVNDRAALARAFAEFDRAGKPTLIVVDSHIGYGAPTRHDTREAHGEPLGADEVKGAKKFYGWPEDAQFLVPDGVRERFAECIGRRGAGLRARWNDLHQGYRTQFPEDAARLDLLLEGRLPENWDRGLPEFPADAKGLATRDSGGKVLNALAKNVPWLLGGAADLSPSTKTNLTFDGAGDFEANHYAGRNFHFGIREHAMGAIINGMALCRLRPYGSTFLIFSDYERAPIRLAALMELPIVQVFTHDSIGLGEDGPTHQPVEQLLALRAIPNMIVLRPADANETLEAWRTILTLQRQPACLVLTRQPVPTLDRTRFAPAAGLARGAYVMADAPGGAPEVILIGTGSEVWMCADAHDRLLEQGVRSRLVSMPSWELFDRQPREYRESVLPPSIEARVAVEQASVMGWDRWVGPRGRVIGMHTFGASAPIKDLQHRFGFEPGKIVDAALELLGRTGA